MISEIIYRTMKITSKEVEEGVVQIVEECKVYRNMFLRKKELTQKLEEAFPENV